MESCVFELLETLSRATIQVATHRLAQQAGMAARAVDKLCAAEAAAEPTAQLWSTERPVRVPVGHGWPARVMPGLCTCHLVQEPLT